MMHGGFGMPDGSFFGGMFFPFGWLGLLLIIIGGVMLHRIFSEGHRNTLKATEILDIKFASGEIDEETYLRKKSILTGKRMI